MNDHSNDDTGVHYYITQRAHSDNLFAVAYAGARTRQGAARESIDHAAAAGFAPLITAERARKNRPGEGDQGGWRILSGRKARSTSKG